MVKANPTISIRVLQGGVENHFGYKASYRKIWLANRESSLEYMAIARSHTTSFLISYLLCRCLQACKPLISIDSTHLYGKYGETLLMVRAQDGNANILSVAFAVVEGKTKEAWSFFLSYLREHVTPQPGVLVISDRYKSIDGALNVEGSL
ncbi:uncharacterized protein [Arachis hypogaea]|uniref:uncharacterized protein n=1 Tax=Arachis hypogaea TaxID=3818 RepID=UPI000DEC5B1F|nr:uncharacterized protein LOC112775481 [Arachis hypogaea]